MASWFLLVASAAVNKHYQLSPYIAARLFWHVHSAIGHCLYF